MELTAFLEHIGLSPAQMPEFTAAGHRLETEELPALTAIDTVFRRTRRIADTETERQALAARTGLSVYTVDALVLIRAAAWLREEYRQQGYGEDVFWASMSDLACKLTECRQVTGVWGTFVAWWYDGFFQTNLFRCGRLEYDRSTVWEGAPCTVGGYAVYPGDRAFEVHIPSGAPLTAASRQESYRLAYDFFARERAGAPLVMFCHSWLLYPRNADIFPAGRNIPDFLRDWQIVESRETPAYEECWRLFGCNYTGDPSALPTDTAARRAMAAWLRQGHLPGEGVGVAVFDGTRLLSRRS